MSWSSPALLTLVSSSFVLLAFSQGPDSTGPIPANVSVEAAESLGRKIFAVLEAERSPSREPSAQTTILISEVEMESFVFYSMEDEIPARIDAIDVTLFEGEIAATTELAFDGEGDSGNPILDLLLRNPHSLFVKGALEGQDGRGRFRLQQVRVDGIPVPLIVVELLVDRFVTPRFPKVDLDEEFQIPWGIESIVLHMDAATVTY